MKITLLNEPASKKPSKTIENTNLIKEFVDVDYDVMSERILYRLTVSRHVDRKLIYILAIVLGASLWGTIGVFSNELEIRGLSAMQVTMVRCIVTVAILFLAILIIDRKGLRIDPKDIWMFLGSGVLGIVTFNVLYFEEVRIGCPLSMVAVLLYTAPLFVLVLSYFIFKEKMGKKKIVAAVIAFAGCALTAGILGSGGDFNFTGFLMGIGSGFGYALYTIFSKFALKKYNPLTLTFYTFLLAGLALCR